MNVRNAVESIYGRNVNCRIEDEVITVWREEFAQPTDAEIDAEVARLQADYDSKQYQRDRNYPDIGEQLDLLYHDITSGKNDKTGEWYKAISKVKTDNPKSS